jgi:hypothetical protein
MWNPFKNERADKLQVQLEKLLEREEERDKKERDEAAEIEAAVKEANRTARLAAEEQERKDAEKTLATEKGDPWINIVSMDMEPGDTANIGAIEMDWNEHFIIMLQKNGYVGVSDEDAVDQWFRDVCKHVILETYEDEETSAERVTRTGLDDGRAEYS